MAENSAVIGSSTESQDNGEKGDLKYVWMHRAKLEALRHRVKSLEARNKKLKKGVIVFSEEPSESIPLVQHALTELQQLQEIMSHDESQLESLPFKLKNQKEDLVKLENMSKDQGNAIQKIKDMMTECINPHTSIPIALPQNPVPSDQLTPVANSSIQCAVSTKTQKYDK